MIYLNNIEEAQTLFVPRNGTSKATGLSLILRNTIGHDTMVHASLDLGTSPLYYNVSVELPSECVPGEYEYILQNEDGEILSSGLLVIEEKISVVEHDNSIEYEQYQTE